jgi:hypothetical protein
VTATPAHELTTSTTLRSARSRATARRTPGSPSIDGFARARAHLGFDDPGWCAPRRAAVLSTLEASSRLTPTQLRTMVRTQHPRLTIRDGTDMVSPGSELKDALGCLREEARRHGRLVAVGQAWAGSNRLIALLTARQPLVVTRVLATVVAGEVLCRLLDDVSDRRVFADNHEQLLREAWRAAHPPPAYFRRPSRG